MNLRAFARWVLPGLLAMALLLSSPGAISKTKDGKENAPEKSEKSEKEGETPTIQRVPNAVYENLRNNVSRIDYYTTNYGIFGLNILQNRAGGIWPRGSSTAYIFGGGIWFGAQKVARDTSGQIIKDALGGDSLRKMAVISYNPNSGASWMVPGRVGDDYKKSPVDNSAQGINNNRIYFSTDYNKVDGTPFDNRDRLAGGFNWPIWDTRPGDSLKVNRYFGEYVEDVTKRNLDPVQGYSKGPAIISGEDVFSTYKDTDLSRYEISRLVAQRAGYPIGIQVEQTDYTWGFGDYANFMFIKYLIINKSADTLLNCWMAPAMDMDIGQAGNDRTKIVIAEKRDDTLNLAIQWSDGEPQRYGYIGFDFLESPAVDSNNYVRTDKRVYSGPEQLGLKTFRNWTIQNDPRSPEERYDFMADPARDIDTGPGDKRFLMSTGPFNLRPGDTARVVVGIMFANGASLAPTGTAQDMRQLLELDHFAQSVYDNNFLAPVPPDQANLSWSPLNNGVKLNWDDGSERSVDFQERGLDFYGYTLQRQRRGSPNATIPKDSTSGWNLNWRTIATWQLPALPDTLTRFLAAQQNDPARLGPWHRLPQLIDIDPSHNGFIYAYRVFRVDTIKRPGLTDSLVTTKVAIDTALSVGEIGPNGKDTVAFAGFTFNTFNDRDTVQRKILRDAIVAIMDSITNGHTYVDVGDDNKDGKIDENAADLSQNEKLINNVFYYYQLLAYDAGSTEDRTPQKTNSGIDGRNIVRATPEAPAAGFPTSAQTVSETALGGIHNFRLAVFDEDRLGQMFGGDTLEFEFQPTDLSRLITATQVFPPYWYISEVIVRRRSTGEELTRFFINYSNNFSDRADSIGLYGDNQLQSFPLDSTFVTYRRGPDSIYNARKVRAVYNNSFISAPDQLVYETTPIYKATFGINFDYSFIQFGDSLRFGKFGDTTTPYQRPLEPFTNPQSNVNLVAREQLVGQRYTGAAPYNAAQIRPPSIGQVKLKVEFGAGGVEDLVVEDRKDTQFTFTAVPYLTVTVKNVAEYKRAVVKEDGTIDSIAVSYDYTFPADPLAQAKGDTTKETNIQLARLIEPGSYALYAYGWILPANDSATRANKLKRNDYLVTEVGASTGTPIGTANRYYLPSNDGKGHTISFTHRLVVNGAEILIDGAAMGAYLANYNSADFPANATTDEFAAGESFIVDFTGGALGLPQPGAKALVAITKPEVPFIDSANGRQYTDDLLDQITVVPNPYLIDHLGQVSTGNRLLYFTRLPEICTIQIYTAAGELLRTIDHQASIENGRVAVDAYDMLTKAGRQVQSQLLVARITTPSGAETIKKFAVVVGGFRIFSR